MPVSPQTHLGLEFEGAPSKLEINMAWLGYGSLESHALEFSWDKKGENHYSPPSRELSLDSQSPHEPNVRVNQ